jgi:3-methylfumaryl-CoA hydratase
VAYQEFVGRTETREDRVDPRLIAGMAATLGRAAPADGSLPPLWHWLLFQDWRPPGELGPDGHPRRGGFLPPVHDLPRRMWAGRRVEFTETPLRVDERARRTSTILKVEEKSGGSGRLVFVTVRHAIEGPRGPALTEEHDVVYRDTEGAAVRAAEPAPAWPGAFAATVAPDAVMLFRYSALTGNGHRIHYDHPYVTQVEGYPGLIVHGPLIATLLVDLCRRQQPTVQLRSFSFKAVRPTFDLHAFRVSGIPSAEGRGARLWAQDHEGWLTMQAEAQFA